MRQWNARRACRTVHKPTTARISHVHTKDVRQNKVSFLDAVVKGAFTVPGDGSLDFETIVKRLADHGYEGWFVVEAEQNPVKSPPLASPLVYLP